jgi:hypothetical protein
MSGPFATIRARADERRMIVDYLRDGRRVGGSTNTQLLAAILADYIERAEHYREPRRRLTSVGIRPNRVP